MKNMIKAFFELLNQNSAETNKTSDHVIVIIDAIMLSLPAMLSCYRYNRCYHNRYHRCFNRCYHIFVIIDVIISSLSLTLLCYRYH